MDKLSFKELMDESKRNFYDNIRRTRNVMSDNPEKNMRPRQQYRIKNRTVYILGAFGAVVASLFVAIETGLIEFDHPAQEFHNQLVLVDPNHQQENRKSDNS